MRFEDGKVFIAFRDLEELDCLTFDEPSTEPGEVWTAQNDAEVMVIRRCEDDGTVKEYEIEIDDTE